MYLALDNLQRLIRHKPKQPTNQLYILKHIKTIFFSANIYTKMAFIYSSNDRIQLQ